MDLPNCVRAGYQTRLKNPVCPNIYFCRRKIAVFKPFQSG